VSSKSARHNSQPVEDGFALLDVAIAIVVLMIVLLPVAYLLSTTAKTAATNQHRLTAQSIAASWLEQERTAAELSQNNLPSPPGGTTSNPTWPAASGTQTVGTTTYDVYLAGGWCAYSGSGTAWGNGQASTTTTGSPPPIDYFVAAKVKWGPNASNPTLVSVNDGSVVEYSSLQSQSSWTADVSGTTESVLTLTTTTGITNLAGSPNICPLGLK
jgi:hypothetical protein